MTQVLGQPLLFELPSEDSFAGPQEKTSPPLPYLNGCVESGLYVRCNELGGHLRDTYVALSQLALASRGCSATTNYAAIQRITETHGVLAGQELERIRRRTAQRETIARDAYRYSVRATVADGQVDPRIGGWFRFRQEYAEPAGRQARDVYREQIKQHAERYGVELPEVV